jgi:hypothetical protein
MDMDTVPFTNRQSIVKVCVVGMLGLAVLLGSSTVSFALKKLAGNNVTCHCWCDTGTNGGIHYGGMLTWNRTSFESCNITGKGCVKDNRQGTIVECDECQPNPEAVGGKICQAAAGYQQGGGYVKPPALRDEAVNPKPLPSYKQNLPIAPGGLPLQNAPVAPTPPTYDPRLPRAGVGGMIAVPRGVEGAPATPAPTEQKDTTSAPK